MLLELLVNKVDRMPDAYFAVIPCLLAPVLWERSGNVKPLVRLLQAAIVLSPRQIVEENLLVCRAVHLSETEFVHFLTNLIYDICRMVF